MSTLPALPDAAPSYLSTVLASCPEFLSVSNDMMAGLSAGAPPSIVTSGKQFIVKENGEDTPIQSFAFNCIILAARPSITKVWYATKFVPGQEPQSPDCMSLDGIRPTADSPLPQCQSCAGCPQNQWGTGTDATGNLGKGKACTDNKILAVFYNGGVYQLKVPPASLKNFAAYLKMLSSRDLYVPAVVTQISCDPVQTYSVLTFNFAQVLSEQHCIAIREKINSPEVKDIVRVPTQAALPAPPVQSAPNQVAAAPVAPAPPVQAAPVAPPAPPKTRARAGAPVAQPAAPVAPANDPMGLGLGIAQPVAPPVQAAPIAPPAEPTTADLTASLGLGL